MSVKAGEVQGDWEGLTVVPSKTDPSTFDFVLFRQHKGAPWSYLRENLNCDEGGPGSCGSEAGSHIGTRVWGIVANGTHATYGSPCTTPCSHTNSAVPETDHDGSWSWGANDDPSTLLALPTAADRWVPWGAGPRNWVDWPGKWGATTGDEGIGGLGEGSPDGPAANGHAADYFEPWTSSQCADSGCVMASTRRHARQIVKDCRAWFGADVAAAACDHARLSRAVDHAGVAGRGDIHLGRGHHRAASAPGLAQLVGAPLRAGERLTVAAHGGLSTLLVRVRNHGRIFEATFSGSKMRDISRGAVTVEAGRRTPRVRLVARGRSVLPQRITELFDQP